MAKIENNIVLYGVSGMIGDQLVVRQSARRRVLAVRPRTPEGRQFTDAQRAQQEKFRLAVEYGKGAKGLPDYEAEAAARGISTFNVATADWLHPAEIVEIDLAGYSGREGDGIRARAVDDVRVTEVGILIVAADNTVIEEGRMTQAPRDRTLWTYTATRAAGSGHVKIIVDASDLPGHVTREEAEKDV